MGDVKFKKLLDIQWRLLLVFDNNLAIGVWVRDGAQGGDESWCGLSGESGLWEELYIFQEELCRRDHRGKGFNKEAWAPGRLLDSARVRRGGQGGGGDSWWRWVAEEFDSKRKAARRAWEIVKSHFTSLLRGQPSRGSHTSVDWHRRSAYGNPDSRAPAQSLWLGSPGVGLQNRIANVCLVRLLLPAKVEPPT